MRHVKIDRLFLVSVIALACVGFFIFSSASLGLLAREGARFSVVALNQFISLLIGFLLFWAISYIPYKNWRKYAFYLFVIAVLMNLALLIPGLSLEHGGAHRWIDLHFYTFQPSEFLKIAYVIYFAAWLSGVKDKVRTFSLGTLPFLSITAFVGVLMVIQSDTDPLITMFAAGLAMFVAAGGRWRDMMIIFLICAIGIGSIAVARPYVRQRIMTYINPEADPRGAGYQIQQSLIAVGSGKAFGRGFGQSIQKFSYLPEPIGDSIFAVAAEEFGFFGGVTLISLFVLFGLRSMKIAARAPDIFGGLVTIGIVILVLVESFMNIAAMLGVIPLSGMPLLFVSHGGTALIVILAAVGIIANISKNQRT